MTDIILDNIYLALLLPLWIFLIVMIGRFFSVYVNKKIIYALTLLCSMFGAFLSGSALWTLSPDKILENEIPFIKINDFIVNFGIYIDRTALIFALVLFLVSFFVQIFAIFYMKNEKKNYRFFALLNLFNFSMAGLFFSPNLFESYVFWEIAGVASYLLIGFEYFKQNKSIASKKVFIINRIGDTAFISGIIICSYLIYSYAPNKNLVTLSFTDMNTISTLVYAYTSTPIFYLICAMFIIAALVKSAQFPFYTWLQDAMEAKLPVSALLHSATIVASGLFLTLRMLPFYTLEGVLLKIISGFGLVTALICSICACTQNHPKKVLAYSTSAQLGLIFYALGNLNLKAAIVFFIAHSFIKSLMFTTLPDSERQWSRFKFVTFLTAGFVLVVFEEIVHSKVFTAVSILTAFYIIRIAILLYNENWIKKLPLFKVPVLYQLGYNGFYLDKLYTIYCTRIYQNFAGFCAKIDNNVFSNYKPLINISYAGVKIAAFVEQYIMHGAVRLITDFAKNISTLDLKAQSGNVQRYNAYAFIIITIIFICIFMAYMVIINKYYGGA